MTETVNPADLDDQQPRTPPEPPPDWEWTIEGVCAGRGGGLVAEVSGVDKSTGAAVGGRGVRRIDDQTEIVRFARAAHASTGRKEATAAHTIVSFNQAVQGALACDSRAVRLEPHDDSAPPERPEFQFCDLRIPMSDVIVWFGAPRTHKSTICMRLAVRMAYEGRTVAWISLENAAEDVDRLVWRIREGARTTEGVEDTSGRLLRLSGRQTSLTRRTAALRRQLAEAEVDYIFIDSGTMAVPGDPSSAEMVKILWEQVGDLVSGVQTGCGVCVIAHTPKHGDKKKAGEPSSPLGSRVWTSYPRMVVAATPSNQKGVPEGVKAVRLEVESNDDQDGMALVVHVRHADGYVSVAGPSAGDYEPQRRALMTADEQMTALLARAIELVSESDEPLRSTDLRRRLRGDPSKVWTGDQVEGFMSEVGTGGHAALMVGDRLPADRGPVKRIVLRPREDEGDAP